MTNHELFISKLNEIKKLALKGPAPDNVSSILLFKDYMSRMYKWYDYFNLPWDYQITKRKEGHDIISILAPDLTADRLSLDYFRLNLLNDTNFGISEFRAFDYFFIYLAIYWEILKEEQKLDAYNKLPEPYLPVIKLLLRGDRIFYFEQFYNVSGVDIRRDNTTLAFRLPELGDDFLNYIDGRCKLVGSLGIPDQQQINHLWEEYKKEQLY